VDQCRLKLEVSSLIEGKAALFDVALVLGRVIGDTHALIVCTIRDDAKHSFGGGLTNERGFPEPNSLRCIAATGLDGKCEVSINCSFGIGQLWPILQWASIWPRTFFEAHVADETARPLHWCGRASNAMPCDW
jgi:hypothetical protein